MEIRLRRVAWARGGGLRSWGIRTVQGDELAGAVELSSGQGGGSRPQTQLKWAVFTEQRSEPLVREAISLAAGWGLANLEPDSVVVLLPDEERVDLGALAAAGFRPDGPAEPWEVGRTRYRFDR